MANVTTIPNTERDDMQAALAMLERVMPSKAKLAKTMQAEFIKVGFSEDEALTLIAYSLFKQ